MLCCVMLGWTCCVGAVVHWCFVLYDAALHEASYLHCSRDVPASSLHARHAEQHSKVHLLLTDTAGLPPFPLGYGMVLVMLSGGIFPSASFQYSQYPQHPPHSAVDCILSRGMHTAAQATGSRGCSAALCCWQGMLSRVWFVVKLQVTCTD